MLEKVDDGDLTMFKNVLMTLKSVRKVDDGDLTMFKNVLMTLKSDRRC